MHIAGGANVSPPPSSPPCAPHARSWLRTALVKLFITFKDMPHLGKTPWETPFGRVTQGMETVVDKFYQGYGDQYPFNEDGINQGTLQQRGNEYLR